MTSTSNPDVTSPSDPAGARLPANPSAQRAMVLLATITMALCAAQFAFAGFGGAGGSFLPHLVTGWIVAGLSILVLIAAILARVERGLMFSAVALVVLAVLLAPFAVELTGRGLELLSSHFTGTPKALSGATHAFLGLIIFGTAGRIMQFGRPPR